MRIYIYAAQGYVEDEDGKEISLGFIRGADIYRADKRIGYVSGSDEYNFGIEAKSYFVYQDEFGCNMVHIEID